MWMVNARAHLPEAKGTEQNASLNIKHRWAAYLLRKIEGSCLMLRSSILASNYFLKLSDKFKPWPTLHISNGSQPHFKLSIPLLGRSFFISPNGLCSVYPSKKCHCLVNTTVEFPGGSEIKNTLENAGDAGSIPESENSSGEGNGNPLQYSYRQRSLMGYSPWCHKRVRCTWVIKWQQQQNTRLGCHKDAR